MLIIDLAFQILSVLRSHQFHEEDFFSFIVFIIFFFFHFLFPLD